MADNFLKISKGINLKPQGTAPSNPAEGDIYFDGQDDAFKRYENGAWRLFGEGEGGGSGGTGENFLSNGNAERSESPWELVQNTTPGATPTPNATAAPNENVTITRSSSSPLNGGHSWLLTKDAANRQGHTLRAVVEIPEGYRDGNVWLKFLAEVSGFGSDVVKPFISFGDGTTWDAPQELTPAISKLQHAAITYPSGETHALIQFHIATTSATAGTVKLDDVQYTPEGFVQTIIERSAVIDLTGSGDFTSGSISVKKVGDQVAISVLTNCVHGNMSSPNSSTGILPVWATPSGNKTNIYESATSENRTFIVRSDGQIGFLYRQHGGTLQNRTSSGSTGSIIYDVPDSDPKPLLSTSEVQGQVSKIQVTRAASLTLVDNTNNLIEYDNEEFKEGSDLELSGGKILVKNSGYYKVSAGSSVNMNAAQTGRSTMRVYVERASVETAVMRDTQRDWNSTFDMTFTHTKSKTLKLQAGDMILLRHEISGVGADRAYQNSSDMSYLQVEKDFDLSVFGAYFEGSLIKKTVYDTAGTHSFTPQKATKRVKVTVIGGGGGGGASNGTGTGGGGGSAGGASLKLIEAKNIAAPETVTVGAGGAGGVSDDGSAGGASSFGSHCSATGGSGGRRLDPAGQAPGAGTGGDLNLTGGGGAAGSVSVPVSGGGGDSLVSGGGRGLYRGGSGATAGVSGSHGSGGGGGARSGGGSEANGGAGGDGVVIVEEYT
jgi:hypothetical protein